MGEDHLQNAKDEVIAAARDFVAAKLADTDVDEKFSALADAIDKLDEADQGEESNPPTDA